MWVRGLKHVEEENLRHLQHVAPRVGAWIETRPTIVKFPQTKVAPRVGAWIETLYDKHLIDKATVAPRVGAWIETYLPLIRRN